ncbi:efflux RND transporter periplasmic adaptor subunit [Sulfurimonas autotrophica]|uniref:Secretion protein HlyD family protein n=1 Tax=Sulfurimonas autotrophica (strain ATCC BAA-671 / DSM 16294 / JCM 11897 / OK10) TaxID=563040 RepID=E0UTT6_SULAO|nr:efflux RND transporter periplasmic adaptor subunit [Sulfurimonas autotrophica]ADN09380.1 secretion protein HlyD family protein [Sulfurimonas autotrophica DSM 16294]
MKKLLLILALGASLMAETLTLSGSVISDNQKMITSRFMGFVTNVNTSEGEKVKKGQVLYSIDSREIDSAKRQAELSLQMYENQYTNVRLNLERYKRLLQKDMVSKYEVENLELAAKNLQDMINIAKARLQEVENQYKYLHVKAPNNGVVVAKNIKVGEMAMPGMPAIVLSDLSDLKISAEIAESNLNLIHHGKKVKVEIPSIGVKTIGTITAIIPNSNPMTHTFKIKVSFKTLNKSVYPGMYATVTIN